MKNRAEFFFDFRSPYSYLAYSQLADLDAEVVLRPMNVLTVMSAVGNTPTTITCAAKGVYARADLARWSQRYGLPIKPGDMRAIDAEACLRAVLAAPSAKSAALTTEALFRASWGQGQTLSMRAMIVDVIAEAGVDTEGLAGRIDDQLVVDALAENCREAGARGIFGAPTIMIGDAMFFGNDRLEFVREHLSLETAA